MLTIEQAKKNRSEICDSILRALPKWFGIESSIQEYVLETNSEDKPFFTAKVNDQCVGFVSVKIHNSLTAEIYVMGVLEEYHRQGIGQAMISEVQKFLKENDFRFLTVKTLSPSRESKEYEKTRKFYEKLGFHALEEFKDLWGNNNPCLFLVKVLD